MYKKILTSLLVIGLTIVLIGGATFANFFDSETSAGNTFTASTLDLTVDGKDDPYVRNFSVTSLAPCRSGEESWVLKNNGKTNGTLSISITVEEDGGVTTEPEETHGYDAGELGEKLWVTLTLDDDVDVEVVYEGYLNDLEEASPFDLGYELSGGKEAEFVLTWKVSESAGNEIQGDIATVDITFMLNQTVAPS